MTGEKIFYLTEEGLESIKRELKYLKEPKGDLSFSESRLHELEHILKNSKLIELPSKGKQNTVYLGATVLASVDGQDNEFTLVGHLEANPSLGRISNESPVGMALLGHRAGDKVVISSPIKTVYKIKKISYSKLV